MKAITNQQWLIRLAPLALAAMVAMCDFFPNDRDSINESDRLLYAPPSTTCTKVITETFGDRVETLDSNCDWRVILPGKPITGKLKIRGGGNIVIIGGAWRMQPNQGDGGLSFYDHRNTSPRIIHVEGVDFVLDDASFTKGIVFEAPTADVRFQNIRITGLHSTYYGVHADAIKSYDARSLKIHKMTVTTDYQGFWLGAGDSAGIRGVRLLGSVHLNEVEFARANLIDNHPIFLMLTDSMNSCVTFPGGAWFNDVFMVQDGPVFGDKEAYPTLSLPPSCPAEPKGGGSILYWPSISGIHGYVERADSLRPFVPKGVPGIDYVSPGYVGLSQD